MAGKVRGITIELSADATGLMNDLKSVNSELKSTGNQLKDVDKLLKLDPGNMDLLKQKTQLLQEQIGNCKEKLETLKQAQADMDANGVDKNSEQYQALQREIIATEQELKKLESTAGSGSAALSKISQVTGTVGEKMETAGKKMSVVSAAIVAFGASAVSAFNEVDSGADIVIKKTGATGDAAEELEKSYKNVAKNIVASWEDIGSAIGEVNTRFKVTGEDLENLSEEFLKFANINEMDVTSAVSGVDMAMKTFNVDQAEAQNVMGLLSKTSQDTGISMDTLLGLLQSSGSTLKEMGLNLESSVMLMGNFEAAGLDSNDMLSKLSKAAAYYTKQGLSMEEGLSDLIARLQDSNTEADATAEAFEIFGNKGATAFITAAKEGKLNISGLQTSLSEYSTVVNDTYQQTLDGTDKMALAWQNVQLALSELGSAIGDTLAPIFEKLTAGIQSAAEWFSNLDEGTKETIVTIGLVVSAIGPLLVAGGKILKGISSITGALSAIGSSTAGPIGLVITAVAALAAGMAVLQESISNAYKEASPFTEALETMTQANKDLSQQIDSTKSSYQANADSIDANAAAAQGLYEHLLTLIEGYDGTAESQENIQSTINQLNQVVPDLGLSWDSVAGSLSKTNEEIYASIEAMRAQAQVAALQDMYTESLKEQYQAQKNVTEAQRTLVDVLAAYGLSVQDWTRYVEGGNAAAVEMEAKLASNGVALWNVKDALNEVTDATNNYLQAKTNEKEVDENVTFAENELAEAAKRAAQATQEAASDIETACSEAFGSIPEQLQAAIEEAEAAGVQIPQSLIDGIKGGETSVEQAAQQLAELTEQKKTASKKAQETGQEYVETMVETIEDGEDDVEDAAQNIADQLDISDEAYDYGEDGGEQFDKGLGSKEGDIQNTAESIKDTVTDTMDDLPGEMNTAGDQSGSNLDNSFGNWRSAVSGTVDDMYEFFYNTLGTMLPPLMSQWGSDSGQKFNSGVKLWTGDIQTTASGIATDVEAALSGLPDSLYGVGDSAGAGLYNGLNAWSATISSLAWSIADSIRQAAQSALDINSPSRVMEKIGQYTGQGLEEGLEGTQKNIFSTAQDIADGISKINPQMNVGTAMLNSGMNAYTASVQTRQDIASLAAISEMLGAYLPYLAQDRDIRFDNGTWAGVLAPAINQELESMRARSARG